MLGLAAIDSWDRLLLQQRCQTIIRRFIKRLRSKRERSKRDCASSETARQRDCDRTHHPGSYGTLMLTSPGSYVTLMFTSPGSYATLMLTALRMRSLPGRASGISHLGPREKWFDMHSRIEKVTKELKGDDGNRGQVLIQP